jgi:uncharacterized protein YjdB
MFLLVTPDPVRMTPNTTRVMTATLVLSDGTFMDVTSTAAWRSSDPGVASVAVGRVTAIRDGQAQIQASMSGLTASAQVFVSSMITLRSIEVTPPMTVIAVRTAVRFTATGVYSDGSRVDLSAMAQWASSSPGVASVVPGGVVTAIAEGSSTIRATVGALSGTAFLTVIGARPVALTIQPGAAAAQPGTDVRFIADATFSDGRHQDVTLSASWISSDPTVAAVSSPGIVRAARTGRVLITADFAGLTATATLSVGTGGLVAIEISPAQVSASVGITLSFRAFGMFSDGTWLDLTNQVTWSSTAPDVVGVAMAGLALTRSPGTALIQARSGNIVGNATVTVLPLRLTSLAITPSQLNLSVGGVGALRAIGTFADGSRLDLTDSAMWGVSAPQVAFVANGPGSGGIVTGLALGSTSVIASWGGVTATATVVVGAAVLMEIQISPAKLALPVGTSQPLQAIGLYSDGTRRDITLEVFWSVSAGGVAAVSNAAGSQGRVTGLSPGEAMITATSGTVAGVASVSVAAVALQTIEVTPANARTTVGLRVLYTARGTYSDGSTALITDQVTWTTADAMIAAISNVPGAQGVLLARAPGTTVVTATLGTVAARTQVTVAALAVSRLALMPATQALTVGSGVQFSLTAFFTDGTSRNVTAEATWSSSATTVATVDAFGFARAVAMGRAVITARYQTSTITATLTVSAPALNSLRVLPDAVMMAGVMNIIPFSVEAVVADGSTRDVTAMASWASSDQRVAVVITPPGNVLTVGPGQTVVTASFMGLTDTAILSVSVLLP